MDAYIVAAKRSAVGKAPKGKLRFLRPDDLAAQVVKKLLSDFPQLEKNQIEDVIVGNATPEAEQGLNIGRMISLLSLDTDKVPGMTVNRFCSSGLEAIAIASSKIHAGLADCIIAGGVECMSVIPFGGWRITPNPMIAKTKPDWYWNMGLTSEEVAKAYNIKRDDQDLFAFESHTKASKAIENGCYKEEIVPIDVNENFINPEGKIETRNYIFDTDEGPRNDTSLEALSKLKPVFSEKGSSTAGNSSQISDGASFLLLMSERMLKHLQLKPVARLKSYAVTGVSPRLMGIAPVSTVPKALDKAGLKMKDIDKIELNEAFASQSLAVIRELKLDKKIVNVNGGAIALGHPLGCTGAKLSTQIIHDLKRNNERYGIVTMCVGTGQGAAGVFEIYN